jgi:type VI secretion system protein ImpK
MPTPTNASPTGRNLSEISSGLFSLILSLRGNSEYGDEATLRERIREYLDGIYAQGQRAGIRREDLEAAGYPLVAFLDETILSSDWQHRERWRDHPLQLELFGERTAGVRFFERLEEARRGGEATRDLLEVFHLCLTLGFEGRYRVTGREELDGLKRAVRRELNLRPDDLREVRLAPHGKRPDSPTARESDGFPFWRYAAVGGGVVVVLYIVFTFWMNGAAGGALDALPPPLY